MTGEARSDTRFFPYNLTRGLPPPRPSVSAPALWIEEHDESGVRWLVSLSGQPVPEPEDAVEVASLEDAKRLVKRWNRREIVATREIEEGSPVYDVMEPEPDEGVAHLLFVAAKAVYERIDYRQEGDVAVPFLDGVTREELHALRSAVVAYEREEAPGL